jgi:hypothetical protein|tara:strand:+ start:1022 stop:1252 length:231 start_codon:yes stop_codon:yes gene_type:complete
MFVTNKIISEIAEDLQSEFEHGDLHSQSSISEIAQVVQNELLERQLPTRKSLAFVVAKNALNLWHETILQTTKRNF